MALISTGYAQTTAGSVTGTITDPNGAVVPGASVQLRHLDTGSIFDGSTTEAGIYLFPSAPVGKYSLTVTHPGFKQSVRPNLEVNVGSRITVDFKLEIGESKVTVEVTAAAPLLETTSPQRGTNLLPQFMNKLPLYSSGIRNAESFVSYMPGVNSGASETSIAGSGGRAKEILVDGASTVSPESGGMAMQNIGAEALTEFKLTTASYSAELGRFGGGVEMFSTKSGTNDIHGSGFWSMRRQFLNAAGYNSNSVVGRPAGYRGKERYNEAGGSFGGPVYIPKVYDGRNKTFFFFSYSRDLRPASFSFANYTVPTDLQRTGDFSGLATIYDPSTTATVNGVSVRTPFAGNIVPKSRWSKVSSNVIPYIPNATSSALTANYMHANTSKFENDIWSIKADHAFTQMNRLSVFVQRYTDSTANVTAFDGPLGTANTSYNKPDTIRINHDLVLKPELLMHTTFGYSSTRSSWTNPQQRGFASKIGIPNQGGDSDATPYISIGGSTLAYSSWGQSDGKVDNGQQLNYTYHLNQAFTWMRGKHEIKFGWDMRRLQTKGHDMAGTAGSFGFHSDQTADPTNRSKTGNGFASFLLGGTYSSSQAALPISDSDIRYGYHAGYVQDNWRVNSRLTLELGMRYEVPIGWHYVNGNYSTLDPKKSNPGAASTPGALMFAGFGAGRENKKRFYPTDWSNIGPRLGFAYRLADKTVIRGGWGIYYQTLGNGGCGCTAGFNFNAGVSSVDVEQIAFWDNPIPYPNNYVAPPNLDPSYQNASSASIMGDTYGKAPRVYTWSASIQHQVKGFLLEAAYVGNRGKGLNSTVEMNQLPFSRLALGSLLTKNIKDPAVVAAGYKEPFVGFYDMWANAKKASQATLMQALKPFPQYTSVSMVNAGVGRTWYDSLQLKAEHRHGAFTFMGNYTFSKSLSMMHLRQIFGQGGYGTQDSFNLADGKSYLPMDQTHVASFLTVYDMPFGKGKRYLTNANKITNAIVSNWSISAAQKYNSGNLFRLSSGVGSLGTALNTQATKAIATGAAIQSGISRKDLDPGNSTVRYFNTGANIPFRNPTAFEYGTAAFYQSALRNPPVFSENISLMKAFTVRERFAFKLRADAFNLFNRTCFGVNGTYTSPDFGRATGPQVGQRVITLGLRLDF